MPTVSCAAWSQEISMSLAGVITFSPSSHYAGLKKDGKWFISLEDVDVIQPFSYPILWLKEMNCNPVVSTVSSLVHLPLYCCTICLWFGMRKERMRISTAESDKADLKAFEYQSATVRFKFFKQRSKRLIFRMNNPWLEWVHSIVMEGFFFQS